MLKKRIIPCLDVDQGRVVKGVNFVELIDAGDPVQQAKIYNEQGADELCFLDITATHEGRKTILDVVEKVAEQVFIPLTVGGGVKTIQDIRNLLNAGADKIAINSAAIKDPEFVRNASQKCGNQCIVVAIDAKCVSSKNSDESAGESADEHQEIKTQNSSSQKTWEIFTHGGRNPTGIDAIAWAKKMEDYGAGELLVTSMDRDGTKKGFDLELTRAISDALSIPVIASGGVGNCDHLVEGVTQGGADAVLAASIFHFGEYTIEETKAAMRDAGVLVRI